MGISKYVSAVVAVTCVVSIVGCATIMQGTRQSVGISSSPTGATVIVDNVKKGKTPLVVDLSRKDHHFVRIEMAGYQPYEATFTRSTSGWVWGNIVFGGLIGLAIDAISGGLYKLTPNEIRAVLQKEGGFSFYKDNNLYITVVLKPDPNWQKIGQLARVN